MADDGRLLGVVCEDRADVRRSVTSLLGRCGFTVAGETTSFGQLLEVVRTARPAVAVVGIPLAGMSTLAAVSLLRQEAPTCQVVVLSPFDELQLAALEAGAEALVAEHDMQALQAVLREVAAGAVRADRPMPPGPRAQAVAPPLSATSSEAALA